MKAHASAATSRITGPIAWHWPTAAIALCIPLVAILALAHGQRAVPFESLSRDATAVAQVPFYIGGLSSLGVLMWSAAAAITLFAWHATSGLSVPGESHPARRFVGLAGLLTLIVLCDDLFLIHDEVCPVYLGVPEVVPMLFYGICLLTLLGLHSGLILRGHWAALSMALGFFAFSAGVDLLPSNTPVLWRIKSLVLEDGAKLLGIGCWLAYFATQSRVLVRGSSAAA